MADNKKSDFRIFCKTNWIMFKPWVIGSILGAVVVTSMVKCSSSRSFEDFNQKIESLQNSNSLQKTR